MSSLDLGSPDVADPETPDPGIGVLAGITCPADLRELAVDRIPLLLAEIRAELVRHVTAAGGHLGPNLGVVELTVALHRTFRSPHDVLVWDVGHQAYVHKMLTGRLDRFGTLRQHGGLSGYPSRAESEHDLVENSHASASLAYADGLAKAFALQGCADRRVVAVIGDGALTGGMAWEALNNIASAPERPVMIVLNDNGRSYGPTVGRLAKHLGALRDGTASGNLFESLGLAYVGPVDGHDVAALERSLRAAALLRHPVVVHVVTRKGEGYGPAETDDLDRMHTISPAGPSKPGQDWTAAFGEALVRLADERPDVVAITAAMLAPTGLQAFACRHPERVFDVGIAEQHAVASAAGLAAAGLHPVVAIYSTFLNRAFDQVLMDAALHGARMTLVIDRAGLTGPDGPSHHGMWDVPLLGLVPDAKLAAPRDTSCLREQLRACAEHDGLSAIRFPRGRCGTDLPAKGRWGSAEVLLDAHDADVLVLPVGPLAVPALAAAEQLRGEGVGVRVVDPCWLQPLDPALVDGARRHRVVVTVEDNAPSGGFGESIARALRADDVRVVTLSLPEREFVPAGERGELLADHGLDAAGIAAAVRSAV